MVVYPPKDTNCISLSKWSGVEAHIKTILRVKVFDNGINLDPNSELRSMACVHRGICDSDGDPHDNRPTRFTYSEKLDTWPHEEHIT